MFRSRAYSQTDQHCSYCARLMPTWHCACKRTVLSSLRRRVRRRDGGCGPGPSPFARRSGGLELSQFAGPASPQPWLADQVKHPCSKDRKLPASRAEEVWHGQSTAIFVFSMSYLNGATRSPDIVPIPRKVVRVQSPNRVSRCLPAQNSINSLAHPPSSQNVTKLWMPG